MIFSLAIYAPPSSQASNSAYQFARAVLEQEHSLYRLFFYHDGVYQGSDLICTPQKEFDLFGAWKKLQEEHEIDIVFCIAASLKRGMIDLDESSRYEKKTFNLNEKFELSGLGQLLDASVMSDRIVTFGG
ncbi:MAG: tRNA 2-thiouridine synthesizing protein D [Cellvibrionaceae bacterium]|jgi:tRNA 2-thiouridine synthesizing protein D